MFDSLSYNIHAYLYKYKKLYMYRCIQYIILLCMYVTKLCKYGYNNTIVSPTIQLYYAHSVLQLCTMGSYIATE